MAENKQTCDELGFPNPNQPSAKQLAKMKEREAKWLFMLDNWASFTTTHPKKFRRRVYKGIPHAVRKFVWPRLTGCADKMARVEADALMPVLPFVRGIVELVAAYALDRTFLDETTAGDRDHEAIEKDTPRAFPDNPRTVQSQAQLRHILQAISNRHFGYYSGMAHFAAVCLLVMEQEAQAFWLMDQLFLASPFQLQTVFGARRSKVEVTSRPECGIQDWVEAFEELMAQELPALHRAFPFPLAIVCSWFGLMFTRTFHPRLWIRVWDVMMLEGSGVLLKAGVTALKFRQATLLRLATSDHDFLMDLSSTLQWEELDDVERFMSALPNVDIKRCAKAQRLGIV